MIQRTDAFTSDGGSRHTITFRATAPSGNGAAFLGGMRIEAPVAPEPAQLANTGFSTAPGRMPSSHTEM